MKAKRFFKIVMKITANCYLLTAILLVSCTGYKTPERGTWSTILKGASFGAMTETAKVAKKPIILGAGVKALESGEVAAYMRAIETELSDTLRKPGIQITRIGGDALVVMVRDAFMSIDYPDISGDGADTLGRLSKVLAKYDRTFIEISGYSDAMRDQNSAIAFSFDMAERVALYLAQHNVKPVRMFVSGRGSARPISDQTDVGRLMNRRVEIRISPILK